MKKWYIIMAVAFVIMLGSTFAKSIDDKDIIPLIEQDMTIPEIHEKLNSYTYEQIYDTILCSAHLNALYRKHGQKRVVKKK